MKKKFDRSINAAEEWDNILISLSLTEGSAQKEVISGMGYARSAIVSSLKVGLVKVKKKFKKYEQQKRMVDEMDVRRVMVEYKILLERVNADYSAHTDDISLASLETLENIAKKEGLDCCLRLMKEQRVVVKKSSTLRLTDEIEMVSNPLGKTLGSSADIEKKKKKDAEVIKEDTTDGPDLEKGATPKSGSIYTA
ncbi:hypothetical protein TL16_g02875 [Triparma laevis f. inornata]|uniref:Uncharacterized protein n=1 Tax=Triparma laevis f. inornata TaxID=1714386 RepID=A0A9W7DZE1_9STRA|nr:hypothetical protein TL16_g02875 [Triparma laevis f. inornata]